MDKMSFDQGRKTGIAEGVEMVMKTARKALSIVPPPSVPLSLPQLAEFMLSKSEGLEVIKNALANRGFGVLEPKAYNESGADFGVYCGEDCPAFLWGIYGESGDPCCALGEMIPIPSKDFDGYFRPGRNCPAVKKAAKEKEGKE